MADLFNNKTSPTEVNAQKLVSRYNSARGNLLLVVILTAVNLIMLVGNVGVYFIFSASIPYGIVDLAMYICGMYPTEVYEMLGEAPTFLPESFFIGAMVIAAIFIILYLICYFLSKKQRVGWMIAALVMFSLDTVSMFLLYDFDYSMIIDIFFHVWVIVSLTSGIMAHYSLKKLPQENVSLPFEDREETDETEELDSTTESDSYSVPDSTILRRADTSVKHRVLAEAELYGHKVVYRRVKKTNELVVDSYVYAEYTAFFEIDHMLTANVDGHAFAAGLDMGSVSYIMVDGRYAVKKMRFI